MFAAVAEFDPIKIATSLPCSREECRKALHPLGLDFAAVERARPDGKVVAAGLEKMEKARGVAGCWEGRTLRQETKRHLFCCLRNINFTHF